MRKPNRLVRERARPLYRPPSIKIYMVENGNLLSDSENDINSTVRPDDWNPDVTVTPNNGEGELDLGD